jgi:hypothetical protein
MGFVLKQMTKQKGKNYKCNLREVGLQNLLIELEEKSLQWFGHVKSGC